MSEYQYYEFMAVDRPLDEGQLRELHALSTRAQITSTGLQTLTASLSSLVDFLRIDQDLLAVATNACAPLEVEDRSDADLAPWVKELPEPERTALILRVVQGDAVSVRAELLRRFRGPVTVNAGHRTVGELLDAAGIRRAERERLAAERQAKERARREREAAIAREERLESLARQEEQAWQRVSALIDTRSSKVSTTQRLRYYGTCRQSASARTALRCLTSASSYCAMRTEGSRA